MMIIEKILNKKLKSLVLEKKLNRYYCLVSVDGKSILTLEELTDNSFVLLIDNELVSDIHQKLGVDKNKISEVIFEWFKKEFKIKDLSDINELFV